MKLSLSFDRYEGRFAVLVTEDGRQVDFPKDLLPKGAKPGDNGMNPAWLKATKPNLVVISCGEGNSYAHPHETTLQLLKRLNVPEKRTDVDGTITIESDGKTWKIKGQQDEDDRTSLIWRSPCQLAA